MTLAALLLILCVWFKCRYLTDNSLELTLFSSRVCYSIGESCCARSLNFVIRYTVKIFCSMDRIPHILYVIRWLVQLWMWITRYLRIFLIVWCYMIRRSVSWLLHRLCVWWRRRIVRRMYRINIWFVHDCRITSRAIISESEKKRKCINILERKK